MMLHPGTMKGSHECKDPPEAEAEASGSTATLSPTRHGAAVTADRLDEKVRLLHGVELANCSSRT